MPPKKQEENLLADMIRDIRHMWVHRKGQEIPGAIVDTFANLGYETKDHRIPVMCAQRRTDYGWHLVFVLPPGISFNRVKKQRDVFQDATNSWINLSWKSGKLHMDVYVGQLPDDPIPYAWDPAPYAKMDLPIPIGMSVADQLVVLDLARAPHMLIGGVTSYGKSNFIHVLIASLLQAPNTKIAIIDCKRLDFRYLRDLCALARNQKEAINLFRALDREMERRFDVLEEAEVVKIQEYHEQGGEMPFIVLVVDELTEISKNEQVMEMLDRVVRLGRAIGISIVAATQRPSVKAIPGDTRANFAARLMFQAASEIDSRVVLGEECSLAANLPCVPGRAIYKFGMVEKEIQAMHLPHEEAKRIAAQARVAQMQGENARGWSIEPARLRLPAR